MNRTLFIIIFLLSSQCFARHSAEKVQIQLFPYVNTDVGKCQALILQRKISGVVSINAGIKLHNNFLQVYPKINNEKFYHRFYAKNIQNKIGITAGLKYQLPWINNMLQPYTYYDITAFNMDCRYQFLPDTGVNSGYAVPLSNFVYKNLYSFENGFGLGIVTALSKKLYLNIKAGGSTNFIFNLPKSEYTNGTHINLSYQYAIGLEYAF